MSYSAVFLGVSYGSILDASLFALYINELPVVVTHCLLDLYADYASYIVVVNRDEWYWNFVLW